MEWFKKKVSPEHPETESNEIVTAKKGGTFGQMMGMARTPKTQKKDSVSINDKDSVPSLETFKTKPVNPKRTHACHLSFQEWFKAEKKYSLTKAQFDSLEKEVPVYSATLEKIVRNNLDVDDAFGQLERVVDPIFAPEVRAMKFLEEEHWPSFWGDWKDHIELQNRAKIITSCVQREIARRRSQQARAAAAIEAESMNVKPVDESALARAREMTRRKVCLILAMELSREGIRKMRIPGMSIRVQSVERGNRVRRRMERYKAWLERRRIWMLEQARARAGLMYMRGMGKDPTKETFDDDVERRMWGRSGYDAGDGVDMSEKFSLLDFIDIPPQGRDHGVRTHKVKIPLQTPYEEKLATEDSNAWVGIPVSMKEVLVNKTRVIGPELRTTSDFESEALSKKEGDQTKFLTSYSWIPAKLVKDAIIDIKETKRNQHQRADVSELGESNDSFS